MLFSELYYKSIHGRFKINPHLFWEGIFLDSGNLISDETFRTQGQIVVENPHLFLMFLSFFVLSRMLHAFILWVIMLISDISKFICCYGLKSLGAFCI